MSYPEKPIVAYVKVATPEAHRALEEVCFKHRDSMFIDLEQRWPAHREAENYRTREIVTLIKDNASDLSDSATPDAIDMLWEVIATIRREFPDAFTAPDGGE